MRLTYKVEPEIKALGIRSIVVAEISGVEIREQDDQLEPLKQEATGAVLKMSEADLAANPVLEGYRKLVQKVGRSAKKFPPAAETLLRQVQRIKCLPRINTAVDSYNIAVTHHFLALGVHDIGKLQGDTVIFRLSPGGEPFVSVGSDIEKRTQPGDYLYADQAQVLAWLDSKDSDRVKLSLDTRDFVIVIQGTALTPREYNRVAAEEACQLIQRFCGGTYEIAAID